MIQILKLDTTNRAHLENKSNLQLFYCIPQPTLRLLPIFIIILKYSSDTVLIFAYLVNVRPQRDERDEQLSEALSSFSLHNSFKMVIKLILFIW